ncbi:MULTISPECIES: pyridoxamine 5'-phosphate oxidase family protein [unclassified Leeuwenhoekiella]|uniref:pyridoxamine 5'-phosphate oxidase family protein n=1 Tax=unclassified Leeuwenhoekiella TaxID=2615029 RepID=UPI000C3B3BAE|nr:MULTISPECIES: pyridoxamine 5'-phosphate oxidase family protein [unclassified Leeuwenhoekiella]MAW95164.1 pyridoxamine 5'-phosphate oxidase [Leeuwenhoekiella sp.]MBA81913.1 pyridoxamine 5'-phosphate oxidase [Leeuwenhoekiella sp.]|tara:strand:+ start:8317 stop:8859 length:543 start_codon:yes stop_codon:yes gene_type:complete
MGKQLPELTSQLIKFIKEQHIFFVGTAAAEGRVNVSPKGMNTFAVLNEREVIWLNMTGSGNETAAHLLKDSRMTIMFCSFERKPLILRLYGKAEMYHPRDKEFESYLNHFEDTQGARQIYKLNIEMVQTSCGFGVPFMEYNGERETLKTWAAEKGDSGIKEYWTEKNQKSIDGFETGIFE